VRHHTFALVVIGLLAACGADHRNTPQPAEQGASAAPVATVNGEPIALGDVLAVCRATELSPRQALAQLVAERLLVQHAAARGYGERPEVQRALTQASVRALLSDAVERSAATEDAAVRRRRLDELLSELAQRTPVKYDEPALARAFAPASP
jgi:hypothetical protein